MRSCSFGKSILLAALPLLLGAAPPRPGAIRYGVVSVAADGGACLTMSGPAIATGTSLIVAFDDPPDAMNAVVTARTDTACGKEALIEGPSYRVTLGRSFDRMPTVGIAALAPGARVVRDQSGVKVRAGAGAPLTFATCAGGEGIHLSAWRGTKRVWHQYYYLGYDVEANCTEKEMSEP